MANIPVTFSGGIRGGPELYVGKKKYFGPSKGVNQFWWVGLNLNDPAGAPVFEDVSSDNTSVPSVVSAQAGNPDVFLCFAFFQVFASHLPTGPLYQFLISIGAGKQLRRLEQIVAQSGSNLLDGAAYNLAATLLENDEPGFEVLDMNSDPIMTFEFMPVDINGKTIYAPVMNN